MALENLENLENSGLASKPAGRRKRYLVELLPYTIPVGLLLVLAAAVRTSGQIFYPDAKYSTWDHIKYLAMATHPLSNNSLVHIPPFCWRILTPWLVHMCIVLLSMPVTDGFWIVTVASLVGATASLMWFLRSLGLSQSSAVIGGLAFVLLAEATGFTLWDYMLVDPLGFFLLVTSMACVVSRRGPWLFVALACYALEKETVLFAAVFAVVYSLEQRDRRLLGWSVAGALISAAIQVAIHVLIHADQPYSLLTEFNRVHSMYEMNANEVWWRLVDAFAGTWSMLLPVAALQFIHRPHILLKPSFLLMLTGATAQVLFSINSSRVVVYAFPIVIAAFVFELEYLSSHTHIRPWFFAIPILILQIPWFIESAGLTTPTDLYSRTIGSIDLNLVDEALLGIGIAIGVCAIYYWMRRFTVRRGSPSTQEDQHDAIPLGAVTTRWQRRSPG